MLAAAGGGCDGGGFAAARMRACGARECARERVARGGLVVGSASVARQPRARRTDSTIYSGPAAGYKSVPTLVSPVSNTISFKLTMRLVRVHIFYGHTTTTHLQHKTVHTI